MSRSSGSTPVPRSWPIASPPNAHRPSYGPDPERFLAEQAARREPLLAGIGAHLIDVDDLTPDEVVERIMETLASIGA